MSVTGTNISLTLRTAKGAALTHEELDANQTALETAIDGHSHDEFSTTPGADGVGVAFVTIDGSGHLIITLTDATTHDAGLVVGTAGIDGVSITSVAIDSSNHLIVTLSTGTTIDAGALPSGGGTGDMLKATYDPDGDGHISYNDLEDKPTIPAAQVSADWNSAVGVNQILNKPTLLAIGTTGTTACAGDDSRLSDSRTPTTHSHAEADVTGLTMALAGKQETLVSGTNVKTINGESVVGSGNIVVTGGSGMANPMTTAGDIIIGGTAGAAERLAKGADGQVLTLASGSPAWGNAASSGASVQQTSVTLAQNASTNIVATSIIAVSEAVLFDIATTANAISGGDAQAMGNAFDNNIATPWVSSQVAPGVAGIAYIGQSGLAANIQSIEITNCSNPANMANFTLQFSNDGILWTEIQSVVANKVANAVWSIAVSPYAPSYPHKIRLLASEDLVSTWSWAINEIKMGENAYSSLSMPADYSIMRTAAIGSQTQTIKRLKTGTATMAIDYI